MKGWWYKVQLLAGIVGVLVVAVGIGVCFVWGLVTVLALVDTEPVAWGLVGVFAAGLLVWLNALRLMWREERPYMRRETQVYDWQSRE